MTVQAIQSKVADLRINGKRISADISDAVTGQVPLKRSISGASSLTLSLSDPNMKLLARPFAKQKSVLVVDGLVFRMLGAKYKAGTTTLPFEDAAVSRLRELKGPKKVSRDKLTRAQFIGRLAAEAGVPFVSPERGIVQPIEARKPKAKKRAEKDERREYGFGAGANIKVKGVKANPDQIRVAEEILDTCVEHKCSFRVMAMSIACATQESNMVDLGSGDYAHPDSRGPFGQWNVPYPNNGTIEGATKGWLFGTPAGDHFGIVEYVRENPEANFSLSIAAVQRCREDLVMEYQQWKDEAGDTVREYLGGTTSTTYEAEVEKPYSFEVGKEENYWEAIQRLAKEVNWRAFVSAGKLYYFTDERLLRSRPRMRITADYVGSGAKNFPPGIDDVDFDVHSGKKVQSATVRGRAATWAAPPGSAVILADDFGLAAGRWLVAEIGTSLTSKDVLIRLKRPSKPLPEPAPETATRSKTIKGTGSKSGKTGIDGVNITSVSPGDPHWGGAYAVFRQFINPFMGQQGLSVGSTKRSYNTGSSVSDHYVGSTLAYAVDYPTGSGEKAARALAKALGATYSPGSWNQSTITVDGHRFACQILWAAPDGTHYDHVHVGLRRL